MPTLLLIVCPGRRKLLLAPLNQFGLSLENPFPPQCVKLQVNPATGRAGSFRGETWGKVFDQFLINAAVRRHHQDGVEGAENRLAEGRPGQLAIDA